MQLIKSSDACKLSILRKHSTILKSVRFKTPRVPCRNAWWSCHPASPVCSNEYYKTNELQKNKQASNQQDLPRCMVSLSAKHLSLCQPRHPWENLLFPYTENIFRLSYVFCLNLLREVCCEPPSLQVGSLHWPQKWQLYINLSVQL